MWSNNAKGIPVSCYLIMTPKTGFENDCVKVVISQTHSEAMLANVSMLTRHVCLP